ncbi:MAG: DUF1311 domain-containing protein [Thermomicrobiales bacterium]|nr:MAG: DUF1311 domain-containing protein [Thermomicrobiales bacterium]
MDRMMRCPARTDLRPTCTESAMKPMKRLPIAINCAMLLPAAALAQAPTFDCAKAQGEVETLICKDAALAALDRRLAEVYKAAAAKARGKLVNQLRAEQRGWVKGRNECWKAKEKTWITATWTVETVADCVAAQYRVRTAELQSVWQLMAPKTVFHACQNNPANELVANFFATDPATIRLERGDRSVTLWQVGAADKGLYEGQNVSLVHAGPDIKVEWLDTNSGKTDVLSCKAK